MIIVIVIIHHEKLYPTLKHEKRYGKKSGLLPTITHDVPLKADPSARYCGGHWFGPQGYTAQSASPRAIQSGYCDQRTARTGCQVPGATSSSCSISTQSHGTGMMFVCKKKIEIKRAEINSVIAAYLKELDAWLSDSRFTTELETHMYHGASRSSSECLQVNSVAISVEWHIISEGLVSSPLNHIRYHSDTASNYSPFLHSPVFLNEFFLPYPH
jgi:hypothetical protein